MRKYYLWLDSYQEVLSFEKEYQKLSKEQRKNLSRYCPVKVCNPLTFYVNKEKKSSFFLPEIDCLTAGYQTEGELLIRLANPIYQGNYEIHKNSHLTITYKDRKQTKQMPLIYNSPLLQQYALRERDKIKNSDRTKELKDTQELMQFCNLLFRFVEDENRRNYLLDPMQIKELSYSKKRQLNSLFPDQKVIPLKDGRVYQENTVRSTLNNYVKIYDIRKKNNQLGEERTEDCIEYAAVQEEVYKALRKNYLTLRNTILFMQEITKVLSPKKEKEDYYQMVFSPTNPQVYFENKEDQENYEEYLKDEEENADIIRDMAEKQQKKYQAWLNDDEEETEEIEDFIEWERRKDQEEEKQLSKNIRRKNG